MFYFLVIYQSSLALEIIVYERASKLKFKEIANLL